MKKSILVLALVVALAASVVVGRSRSDGSNQDVADNVKKEACKGNACPITGGGEKACKVKAAECTKDPATCKKDCSKCPDAGTAKCAKEAGKCPKDGAAKAACSTDGSKKGKCPVDAGKSAKVDAHAGHGHGAGACPSEAAKVVAPVEVEAPKVDELIATVNGVKIMSSKIDEMIAPSLNRHKMMGQAPNEQMISYYSQRAMVGVIQEMVLTKAVKEAGIVIGDDEVKAKITEMAKERDMTAEQLLAMATQQGADIKQIEEQLKLGIAADKLLESKFDGDALTDADYEKFYNENAANFATEEQVRASHILIMTQGKDEAGKAEALKKIEGILAQAKGGADFAELAKANTEDPGSKETGGEYTFGRGKMVPAFEEAAFGLEVDGISGVVETNYGYHIIKLSEKIAAKVTSYEEAKADIAKQMDGQQKGEFAMKYVDGLVNAAKIEWAEGMEEVYSMPKPPAARVQPAVQRGEAKPKVVEVKAETK